ncbi:MAG: hypothetical protein RL885_12855 [Planctomycetota bacterium]
MSPYPACPFWPFRVSAFRLVLLFVLVLASACSDSEEEEKPKDEAMLRAEAEGLSPRAAAESYFREEYEDTAAGQPKWYDYFKGMDAHVAGGSRPWALLDQSDANLTGAASWSNLEDPVDSPSEALGRNSWMMWCGGNEAFWDWLANNGVGFVDLLKLLDSRERRTRFDEAGLINEPRMQGARSPANNDFGLWLDQPSDPRKRAWRDEYLKYTFERFARRAHRLQAGLFDEEGPEQSESKEDLEAQSQKLRKLGVPRPDIYGLSSGIVGLRLFPNPHFDGEAQDAWDAERYQSDPKYYSDPKLVRPFRVGMACSFCHASFHPLNPPSDITDPGWENISGNIGAQYLRIRAVFGNLLEEDNFVYHILDSQPPGTIDTSLVASDNLNNPNTMNSVFGVPWRLVRSFEWPKEKLSAASMTQPSLWGNLDSGYGSEAPSYDYDGGGHYYGDDTVPEDWTNIFGSVGLGGELAASNENPRRVPRILLDGADSIGAWGALARVYLNIGTFHQEWVTLHEPLIGFKPQKPFRIDACDRRSVHWNATQRRVGPMRDYFLKVTDPMPLLAAKGALAISDAPSAEEARKAVSEHVDIDQLARGRQVFAKNCIVCHSSIQPESTLASGLSGDFAGLEALAERRKQQISQWSLDSETVTAGEVWDHDPGRWLRDADYAAWAALIVEKPGFWTQNYFSTDFRIPVNTVETNSARAMATNGITGSMWEDFSSETYRHLPSVGPIEYFNPYLGEDGGLDTFLPGHAVKGDAPEGGGGPGYYRVPTLISIWATAPLLHNNSLGLFNNDPSIEGRVAAFEDAMEKLLWPEKRLQSSSYNGATRSRLKKDHGLIWRTTQESYLELPGTHVPYLLSMRADLVMRLAESRWFSWLQSVRPPWLTSAILLVIAFLLLCFAKRRWVRTFGYASIVLALAAGGLVYFANGDLGNVKIGPIPKGTPVNLLANVNPDADPAELKAAIVKTLDTLASIESEHVTEDEKARRLREEVAPALMKVSKCPDFVMDRGHYFEWFDSMTDADKRALIELLKTL